MANFLTRPDILNHGGVNSVSYLVLHITLVTKRQAVAEFCLVRLGSGIELKALTTRPLRKSESFGRVWCEKNCIFSFAQLFVELAMCLMSLLLLLLGRIHIFRCWQ